MRKPKLTIGMGTYDDFDGVYFTINSIRMYHPEVIDDIEFIVLDNNPSGKCAEPLKDMGKVIKNYRYIPFTDFNGSMVCGQTFNHARADYVMTVDGHVLIDSGAIAKLIQYFEDHPDTIDFIQGPMWQENLKGVFTHWNPIWSGGMYGKWGLDERYSPDDDAPFEIPMQGLALYACRKDAWVGYNKHFTGFGGGGGYLHEKFRQRGGKVLCLPFLRWLHRFPRPLGVPYPIDWESRIFNYIVGFTELGLDTKPIIKHFTELLGVDSKALVSARKRAVGAIAETQCKYCNSASMSPHMAGCPNQDQ